VKLADAAVRPVNKHQSKIPMQSSFSIWLQSGHNASSENRKLIYLSM